MRTTIWCRNTFRLLAIALPFLCPCSISVGATTDEMADQEAAEASAERAYKRYMQLLKRKPQAGVSLDRIYGHHIDRGTLDEFIKSLTDEMAADDADGSSAMIMGLIESRRGRDTAARKAFETAEQKRPTDPMASWYLGQSLVAIGEVDSAAEALERSLSRNIPRAVQEKVFQMLGRIYQRGQRSEKAIQLWQRFEQAFPDDDRVQEQIASIQIEENQLEEALVRYERMAAKSTDPYKRVQFGIKAADLKLKLGKTNDGLSMFESLLQDLKPSSWLYNDVRDRIEKSFLRTDDYAGLVNYYEKWIDTHPDDVDAMSRIGKYLAIQGRTTDAETWYTKAIQKAPSDPKLRLALIEQLIGDEKYPDAIQQYEQLAEIDRGNPDHIERWGMLYLRHPDLGKSAQQEKAAKVWAQLTEGKDDDAVVISRVADLMRSAQMTDNAIKMYRKAIALEPQNPQYREYLGEYLHNLQRSEEAKTVWQAMIAGDQRTTQNLTRLSEVYKSFGYIEEALTTLEAACEMDPEFGDLIRFSNMLRDALRFEDSLAQLDRVEKLAASADEIQIILEARVKTLSESGQLPAATAALERKVAADSSAQQWRILAFYQEAMNRLPDASRSAGRAVDLEPESIPAWTVAARVMEKAGLLADASNANRTLADLDRRFRTQYLKKIAELERRLGRIDNAIQAAQDVITSAPGNPENYRFYADLCFQLGKPDLGLDALRRSVRINPSDVESLTGLAEALADQFKTDEAIEFYWRAFQKAEKLDGKISVVQTLSDLYLQTNSFDKLITRLQNLGKELSQQRDMTICLANAYQASGDVGLAREELKGLLQGESRDVILLDELALLAEQANEYEEAIDYQKQIVQITKTEEARGRLASLMLRAGDVDAAKLLWAQSSGKNSQSNQQVDSIDDLITAGKLKAARKQYDELLSQNDEDWDALLRLAIIDWKEGHKQDAAKRCEQILAMRQPLDTLSHLKKSQRANNPAGSVGRQSNSQIVQKTPAFYARSSTMFRIKNALGIAPSNTPLQSNEAAWIVSDFGECRIAAITIQMAVLHEDAKFLSQLQAKAEATIQQDSVAAWDWWYALSFQQQTLRASAYGTDQQRKVAELLYLADEPEARLLYANVLYMSLRRSQSTEPADATPFTDRDANRMVQAWQQVNAAHPQWSKYTGSTVRNMIVDLRRSGFNDFADELMRRLLRKDARPDELQTALQIVATEGDVDRMLEVTERLVQLQQANPNAAGRTDILTSLGPTFAAQAAKLAEKDEWQSSRKLLVKFLDIKSATFNPLSSSASGSRAMISQVRTTVTSGSLAMGQRRQSGLVSFNLMGPTRYYSTLDLQFFTMAHSLYANQTTGRSPNELNTILAEYRSKATGQQVIFAELALAHIATLNGSLEQSAVHLVRAAAEAPEDASLRLSLVAYYQQRGNHAEALQLLDTVEAVDQLILNDKELLALDLALKTANTERARKAAERLFGLRLDPNTAIQLSNKMQALDMKEMAAALLARTRKVAGNNLTSLLALMNKYVSAGDSDVACQIAHQILRQTNGQKASRSGPDPDIARKAAVTVLGKSGQLESIIQRTIDQLSRSPKSVRLHQTLIEYYVAAGRSQDAAQMRESLTALIPVTAGSLLREGKQLEVGRKYSAACDKYLQAFEQDPQILAKNYFVFLRTFGSAKRLPEFADLLLQDDGLNKLQNNYQIVTQTIEAMYRSGVVPTNGGTPTGTAHQKAMDLFRAAWKQFPNQRADLIAGINSPFAWREPEMVKYAQAGLIPTTLQRSIATPWKGLAEGIESYGPSGEVIGTLNRVVKALGNQPKERETYISQVEAAVQQFNKWHGGKALLAALKASAGDRDDAYQLLVQLETDPEVLFIPTNISWVLSSTLTALNEPRFTKISARLLKGSLASDNSASNRLVLASSPERRLAFLYSKLDDTENARQVLRNWVKNLDYSPNPSRQGFAESRRVQAYVAVADEFLNIGCPFDAMEYYRKVTPELEASTGRYGTQIKREVIKARMSSTKIMTAMSTDAVVDFVQRSQDEASAGLDLSLMPQGSKDDAKVIRSLVVDTLRQLNRTKDIAMLSRILGKVLDQEDIQSPLPAIVAFEFALLTNNSNLYQTSMDKLDAYIKQTPAEKDRSLSDISLWIPARSAFIAQRDLELAERLANRAQAAAEAHEDDRWLISMMQEKGEIAIEAGDKPAAEKAWSRLLDAVLADSSPAPTQLPANSRTIQRRSQQSPSESALDELRDKLLNKPATLTP